jgi:ribulose-5-phosphate 4-epimerase/fuculose-1-phosphate aldolase
MRAGHRHKADHDKDKDQGNQQSGSVDDPTGLADAASSGRIDGLHPIIVAQSGVEAATIRHRIVVWAKHGVMARSDVSVKRAGDRIEYAETGARYEYMNLANGEQGVGLTAEEIRGICAAFDIKQTIF